MIELHTRSDSKMLAAVEPIMDSHLEVDRALIRRKRHAVHRPRRCQPQGQGEKVFLHDARLTASAPAFHSRRDGAKKFKIITL